MDKLRIGVFLEDGFKPTLGGGFSYYERLIQKIDDFVFDASIEVFFLSKSTISKENFKKKILEIPISKFRNQHWSFIYKFIFRIFSFSVLRYFRIQEKIKNKIEKQIAKDSIIFLKQNKVDLVYYPTQNRYPMDYPFIATHWDLGHKTMFAFPEVTLHNKFEKRENYHRVILQKAFAIFAESEQSKKELIELEQINENRIFVVPLFAGKVVELNVYEKQQTDILQKWSLDKNKFYFYPAQFWAHKNHYGLLMAFQMVLKNNPKLKLVLSGSDKGNLSYIKGIVKELNLESNVLFTGFVTDEEIYAFYKNAIALVMPTFLGPTNMPLLEANRLGCTVICSDLNGHKQQMKENAIYFDPSNFVDIATKMESVIDSKKSFTTIPESNTCEILNQHFKSLYNVRKTFGYDF